MTNRESFTSVGHWLAEIEKFAGKNVCKILVGNKADSENRDVTTEEGQQLAGQMAMPFLETSAKSATGVSEAFQMMLKELKNKHREA